MANDSDLDRYSRQVRYPPLGEAGQRRLLAGRVLICGCGALGSAQANLLVRAGVGRLRIVDRDYLELSNLQRQSLFDESDVAANLPKAVAAAAKLRAINSQVEIEPIVADVDHTNILGLCEGVDVILDGTDNFETRFLLNDAALRLRRPWVFGGCLGAEGQTLTIVPGETPCLRCVQPEPPPPGATPTCETAGILGPTVGMVAALQAMEAIKLLAGACEAINRGMTVIDLWTNRVRQVGLKAFETGGGCPACERGRLDWLSGERAAQSAILCGRNAVQLRAPADGLSLDELADKLGGVGRITRNKYLLRLEVDGYTLTLFADGRAIIAGVSDIAAARGVYAKYVGG